MEWGETAALATVTLSLASAVAYWLVFSTRAVKGSAGTFVKTAATALLAMVALMVPLGHGFWLVALGLTMGALGDMFLALGGLHRFLAGIAAFGIGHLAYTAAYLWRAVDFGLDALSVAEGVAIAGLAGLVLSTERWLAPRTADLRQPVRVYVGLIGVMGLAALLLPAYPGQGWLRLGAALFVLSDVMLALQLFVVRSPGLRQGLAFALWPAYWSAQALILYGAVQYWRGQA